MAWKETARAAAVMYRRRYRCGDCDKTFDQRVADQNDPPPECPYCPKVTAALTPAGPVIAWVAPLPALGTNKGRAIDLAQKMAEEDYGLTDMNDNQRAGDIAAKVAAPMTGPQADTAIREWMEMSQAVATQMPAGVPPAPGAEPTLLNDPRKQAENYWQGHQGTAAADQSIGQGTVASQASKAQRDMGIDAVGILEHGRASGMMQPRLNVVASVTEEEAKAGG